MSIGPLRRLVGAVGLVAMAPLLLMLSLGALSAVDAAVRAVVMVLVLLLSGRAVGWGVKYMATSVEADAERDVDHSPNTGRADVG